MHATDEYEFIRHRNRVRTTDSRAAADLSARAWRHSVARAARRDDGDTQAGAVERWHEIIRRKAFVSGGAA